MKKIFNFFKQKHSNYSGLSLEASFSKIYEENHWKSTESASGSGSEQNQTIEVVKIINKVIKNYSIESILDIPCGDMNWISDSDITKIKYIGADIVPDIVAKNTLKFSHIPNFEFRHLDLTISNLPAVDLVFSRDCLVHLSNKDIFLALKNIRNSKYLLTTSFTNNNRINKDIISGDWRPINLQKPPYSLVNPIEAFKEFCTEGNGKYDDKSLLLFDIKELQIILKSLDS